MGTPSTRLPVPAPNELACAGDGQSNEDCPIQTRQSLVRSDPGRRGAGGGVAACRLKRDLESGFRWRGCPRTCADGSATGST